MNHAKIKFVLFFFTMHVQLIYGQHNETSEKSNEEAIIEQYLKNGAWNHHYLSKEWQEWIDKGIQADSTIAFLWQQKALPYWKQKKYPLAINFFNKAVALDRKSWLPRLCYLKCIFAKDYVGALADLTACQKEFGQLFEQDHPLMFYTGICHLQLNQFEDAVRVLKSNIEFLEKTFSAENVHYLDRYYLAIAYYELNNYELANKELDTVLITYPNFSDAQYYKSLCLHYLGDHENAQHLMITGKSNFEKKITFNEDGNLYETYPYQLTWQWKSGLHLVK